MFNIIEDKHPAPAHVLQSLGTRFKELRMRLNYTQREISEITGISLPTIYKFENGRLTDMTFSNLYKLTEAIQENGNWLTLIPEYPESPYMYKKDKKKQRIRHKK